MKRTVLLNPGPACTSEAVKQAMISVGDVCPREVEVGDLMGSISHKVKKLLTSKPEKYECSILTSSGTGAVEMVISSLPSDAYVLNIINGSYGERIEEMLQVYNIPHETINYKEEPLHCDEIRKYLLNNSFTHISFVHCETTTGIINDLTVLARYAKENGVKVIVDAMSSAFAYPIDMEKDGIHFLCCSSNKLVQGMAGIGMVIVDKESLEKCQGRTVYLDLKEQINYFNKTSQMRFTAPVQILNSLNVALNELIEETVAGRYERYKHLNELIRTEMEALGFKALIPENKNSVVITSFLEPEGFNFVEFHAALKERGFIIYPGKVSMKNTFRLSNIGDITEDEILEFLSIVKEIYTKNKI